MEKSKLAEETPEGFYRDLNISEPKGGYIMGAAIEYQKLMTEIVYINLPGPQEPGPTMTGGELLHGFLAELNRAPSSEVKAFVNGLCSKWNVHYRDGHNTR
jgi:hypothetical protein